jgi:hypothetical protein
LGGLRAGTASVWCEEVEGAWWGLFFVCRNPVRSRFFALFLGLFSLGVGGRNTRGVVSLGARGIGEVLFRFGLWRSVHIRPDHCIGAARIFGMIA